MVKNKSLTVYQIYTSSFFDSNNDGIGDLKGIIKKLPYIKDLGCDAIWLNPIFESPFNDGGYDITNFFKINPLFGSFSSLKKLIKLAHQNKLKIFLDLVPGHMSIHSKDFKNGLKGKNELFIFSNRESRESDNLKLININNKFYKSFLSNYYPFQASLNYGFFNVDEDWQISYKNSKIDKTKKYIIEVIKYYLDLGVDGFRVDMAGSLVKNDPDFIGTAEVWNDIFNKIKVDYPEAYFVSEWNNPNKAGQAGFDADFDLFGPGIFEETFRDGKIIYSKIEKMFTELSTRINNAKKSNISLANISGNHDQKRIASLLGEKLSKSYLILAAFLPGDFYLYYGDEIGLKTYDVKDKDGGKERTGSRTPFQWNNGLNRGFSTSKNLYLPVSDDNVSLENNLEDMNSTYSIVKKIISLRRKFGLVKENFQIKIMKDKVVLLREEYELILNISNKNLCVKNPVIFSGDSGLILKPLEVCVIKKY